MRNCWFRFPERCSRGTLWYKNTVDLINDATKILELYFSYHNEN